MDSKEIINEKDAEEEIEEEEEDSIPKDKLKNPDDLTTIGNKQYDKDTLNRITIVRLTQVGVKPSEIKKMLGISRALVHKWAHYDKREKKKMGRPPKFNQVHKDFIYNTSEGKLTILNKVSSRNISEKFSKEFDKTISFSYVCKLLLEKYGRPYRGINSILLTEDHISQRMAFTEEIIKKGIKSGDIMFTDECRI